MPASRRSAAEIAADLKRLQEASVDDRDRQSLLHELSVHQEELLVQNESLQRAWVALEESRDRFIELYDFAPNGYVTLDEHGIIQQCNLTAAALLAKRRFTGCRSSVSSCWRIVRSTSSSCVAVAYW
jgi:PAS domain-containing protein